MMVLMVMLMVKKMMVMIYNGNGGNNNDRGGDNDLKNLPILSRSALECLRFLGGEAFTVTLCDNR